MVEMIKDYLEEKMELKNEQVELINNYVRLNNAMTAVNIGCTVAIGAAASISMLIIATNKSK